MSFLGCVMTGWGSFNVLVVVCGLVGGRHRPEPQVVPRSFEDPTALPLELRCERLAGPARAGR